MDVGTVRIDTTLQEKLTAAVTRGLCPRKIKEVKRESLSGYLQGFYQIGDYFGRSLGSQQG